MKRVFVFCIGGTGLRVMKSITMLLAAGMDARGYTVVPVFIDPHIDLEEKRNLQNLIQDYENIYEAITVSDRKHLNPIHGFFGTEIANLAKINGQQNDISEPHCREAFFRSVPQCWEPEFGRCEQLSSSDNVLTGQS